MARVREGNDHRQPPALARRERHDDAGPPPGHEGAGLPGDLGVRPPPRAGRGAVASTAMRTLRRLSFTAAAALLLAPLPLAGEGRPLKVDDLFALRDVSDPRISPDGRHVAYALATLDLKEDDSDRTSTSCRWTAASRCASPPGRRTSPRRASAPTVGGSRSSRIARARRRRSTCSAVVAERRSSSPTSRGASRTWPGLRTRSGSPSSSPTSIPTPRTKGKGTRRRKRRRRRRRRSRSCSAGSSSSATARATCARCASTSTSSTWTKKTSVQVTSGPFDDSDPAWSPRRPADRLRQQPHPPDPDRSQNRTSSWSRRARARSRARVPTGPGTDSSPRLQPGRALDRLRGAAATRRTSGTARATWRSCPVGRRPAARPSPRRSTATSPSPRFTPDGRARAVPARGRRQPAPRAGGGRGRGVERVVAGERDVQAFDVAPGGAIVVLESSPHQPAEISAVARGRRCDA